MVIWKAFIDPEHLRLLALSKQTKTTYACRSQNLIPLITCDCGWYHDGEMLVSCLTTPKTSAHQFDEFITTGIYIYRVNQKYVKPASGANVNV